MTAQANTKAAYEAWHAQLGVDDSSNTPWHGLLRAYLDVERDLNGRRVLEIGCGRGDFTCWLARQPKRPTEILAADFSVTALQKGSAFAEKLGLTGITWEEHDIQAIKHPAESFDTVISCETIEHVPDPRRALQELARVLKPGGRLYLTTPNYLGIYGLYRIYLRLCGRPYTEIGQPINRFLVLPLTCMWVAQTGLRLKVVDASGHYLLWPGHLPKDLLWFNKPKTVVKWFGLHSLIVAEKPEC